jgi:predicted PurR-regulated permease PerM
MSETSASGKLQGRAVSVEAPEAPDAATAVPAASATISAAVQAPARSRVFATVQRDGQRRIIAGAAAAVAIWFLYQVRDILPPFIAAALLAALLDPTVRHIEHHGRSRIRAVLILFAFFISMFVLVVVVVGPRVAEEVQDVSSNTGVYYRHVEDTANRFLSKNAGLLSKAGIKENRLNTLVNDHWGPVEQKINQMLGSLSGFLQNAAGKAIWLIIIPVATFFLLRDYPMIRAKTISLFPEEAQNRIDAVSREIVDVFIAYLRGLAKLCIVYAIASYFVFLLLGLNYALFIAIIAGLFYMIPYLGPFLTAGAVGVVAYSMDAHTALGFWHVGANSLIYAIAVICIQIGVNQIFDQIVFPRIVGESVGLHPVVTLFALMAGYSVMSVWGMLLAVPVAASVQIILTYCFPRVSQPPPARLLAEPEPVPDAAPVN